MKPLTKTVARRVGGLAAQISPAEEPKPQKPAKPKVANKPVANPAVANVANKPRYARWRDKNPELYLERQAKYQAAYRAKKRAAEPR